MVGQALLRRLANEGSDVVTVSRSQVDLTDQRETEDWVEEVRPEVVFVAAAKVGGILANDTYPADFIRDNLAISQNVIHASYRHGVQKLLYLGSSCIYPRDANQPIAEEELLSGRLESTNEWYALAKIAGVKLCQAYRRQHGCNFISAMPCNLYGPGDNFDLKSSHVLPALIRKAYEAKVNRLNELHVWGTGKARREFLHVEDCADALVHLIKHYSGERHINVGTGEDLTIAELAGKIAREVEFNGEVRFDTSKPDGTPRKVVDVRRLSSMGWNASISIDEGIRDVCRWYRQHVAKTEADVAYA